MNEALARIEGPELFRCQGRAQVLRSVLDWEAPARDALAKPAKPAPRQMVSTEFGQRDNPHFR